MSPRPGSSEALAPPDAIFHLTDGFVKSDVVRRIEELRALKRAHPQLITPDSLTQQVGDLASRAFDKVRHSKPMLSLANALTSEDVTDFVRRIRRFF